MNNEKVNTAPDSMESLRQTIRQQAAAIQAKGRLLDNMAYQIRTLSNAVVGFSDLLLTEDLSDEQKDFVTEINEAGKGLSELVNEALDWARLGAGRLQVVRSAYVLDDILNQLEQSIRPSAKDKGLAFEMHRDAALPETITTDAERLLKCLINLAANAIQYTDTGFIRVSACLEKREQNTFVRFSISDSGSGIAADKLQTLFEPTLREEDANMQAVSMLGRRLSAAAGLPLTCQLAELLGGTLEAESEPDKGSTFSLWIPIGPVAEAASAPGLTRKTPTADSQTAQEGALPILLVEDQESNRTVVKLMLQSMGYEVKTAVDGQEAVDMATAGAYRLIIMDLKMPRMDGYEATRCLRQKQLKTPIIALTAMTLNADEEKEIHSLFDGFLSKPVNTEQLMAEIDRFAPQATSAVYTADQP